MRRSMVVLLCALVVGLVSTIWLGSAVAQSTDEGLMGYFPMQPGAQWTYRVEILGTAYIYDEVVHEEDNNNYSYMSEGYLYPEDEAVLQYRIEAPAPRQGPFQYDSGVELTLLGDDLEMYFQVEGVYYNTLYTLQGETIVQQVLIHTPMPSAGWGPGGGEEYSLRVVFFTVRPEVWEIALDNINEFRPYISINLGDSHDMLTFVGVDSQVPGYEGELAMKFQRTVDLSDSEQMTGFTEDLWFVMGVGLVRLEQRVDDEITMTWELDTFVPVLGSNS